MPFNMLVTSCYLQGTSYKDSDPHSPKISLKLANNSKERVLFFVIDEKSNPKSKFREFFGMEEPGEKICDLLVYYSNDDNGENSLIITETKGSDFDSAADQIINTFKKLHSDLKFCNNNYCKKLKLKACCVSNRGKIVGMDDKKKKAKDKVIKATSLSKKSCDFINSERFQDFVTGYSFKKK